MTLSVCASTVRSQSSLVADQPTLCGFSQHPSCESGVRSLWGLGAGPLPPPAVTRETPYSHRRSDPVASRARDSFQTPSSTHFRRCQMRRSVSKPRSPLRRTRRGLASSEIILIHSSPRLLSRIRRRGGEGHGRRRGSGRRTAESVQRKPSVSPEATGASRH